MNADSARQPSVRPFAESFEREDPFPLLDYLQLLWFRRRMVGAITVLVAVLGLIHVNQLQSIYTAQSSLLIGVHESQPTDLNTYIYNRYFGMEPIEEIEILKSRRIAEKVIGNLNLLDHPEFNPALREERTGLGDYLRYLNPVNWIPSAWKTAVREAISGEIESVPVVPQDRERSLMTRAVDRFLSRMDAQAIEYSDVIQITFRASDPVLAARVANEIPDAYIVDKLEAKFEATERVTGWLGEQLEELERKVSESEQAVEIYREQYGLTRGTQTDILAEQLSSINSQLIIAKAERAEAEARLSQMRRLLAEEGGGVETATDVLSSPLIQQLRNQEAAVMRRASELAVEFGPKHPRMLQVQAELQDVRGRIREETRKIIVALENEVEVARTREATLQESLREAERATGAQNREAVQLRALEREAAANRTLFETFLNRFKETSSTQGMESADARVISKAEIPSSPSYPNRKRTFVVIVMLGFLGACGLVLAIHFLNPGVFSPEQVEQELGLHAIGMIPRIRGKVEPHEFVLDKPASGYVEAINSLKISLELSDPDRPIRVVQVTSSVPEEGKTSLVITLATVLARSGHRVVIVDGDLRRSSIEKKLGLSSEGKGLTDFVIAHTEDPSEFVVTDDRIGVDLLRTGEAHYVSATDLFSSRRMRSIMEALRERYDYVLLDSPPVMAVADARVLGQLADKTLFVVRWDRTPKKVARAAIDLLRKAGVPIAGAVLQQVDLKRFGRLGYGDSGYYYHYGRYGKYYQS